MKNQQPAPVAIISSQRGERRGQHAFGVCIRGYVLPPEKVIEVETAVGAEFKPVAKEAKVTIYKNSLVVFVRVSADVVTRQKLTGCCKRLGRLLIEHGVAKETVYCSVLPPPARPTLTVV